MKRMKSVVVFGLLLFMVGVISTSAWAWGDKREVVKGSGKVAESKRTVKDFDRLYFEGSGEVYIRQGIKESLKIEAEDNFLPLINTEVSKGELRIIFKKDLELKPNEPIKFYLVVKELKRIETSMVGEIECKQLKTERFEFKGRFVGEIAFGLETKEVECDIESVGEMRLSGESERAELKLKGVGSFEARDLKCKECDVELMGIGDAEVYASERLKARVVGIGSLKYWGDPEEVDQKSSGLGEVERME